MGAPPAFQFYPDDFIAGTCDMSQAEVGAYVRLLCYQWNRGSTTVQPEKLERIAGGPVTQDVLSKFKKCDDGELRNERLELERQKQAEYREKQRENGKKSAEARRKKDEPQVNGGSTVVQPTLEPKGNSPSPSPSSNKTYNGATAPDGFVATGRMLRLNKMFNRRDTTRWDQRELKAYKKTAELCPIEEFELVEARYLSNGPFIRHDLLTLLNNWNGEVDRARKSGTKPNGTVTVEVPFQ